MTVIALISIVTFEGVFVSCVAHQVSLHGCSAEPPEAPSGDTRGHQALSMQNLCLLRKHGNLSEDPLCAEPRRPGGPASG